MTPKEIAEHRDLFYKIIKDAELGLNNLRNNCPHVNKFEGLYSWRPGATDPATICSDCGELIKIHNDALNFTITVSDNITSAS